MLAKLGIGFSETKTRAHLRMAIKRIQLYVSKNTNLIAQQKRDVAMLLAQDKDELARVRVEGIIRQDFTIEAFEILALHAELLAERLRYVASEDTPPQDMLEALNTLCYAASRASAIEELETVKSQIKAKYGHEFVEAAMENRHDCVNARVVLKLSVQPPSAFLVQRYMEEIAAAHGIEWTAPELSGADGQEVDEQLMPMPVPTGESVPMAPGSGISQVYSAPPTAASAGAAAPQPISQPGVQPVAALPPQQVLAVAGEQGKAHINEEGLLDFRSVPAPAPAPAPTPGPTPAAAAMPPAAYSMPAVPGTPPGAVAGAVPAVAPAAAPAPGTVQDAPPPYESANLFPTVPQEPPAGQAGTGVPTGFDLPSVPGGTSADGTGGVPSGDPSGGGGDGGAAAGAGAGAGVVSGGPDDAPSYDALAARFNALRK